ncbi:disintegrin and metalloproteinase domain-containing protein 21-like [Diceros bicornis minor]|uniref:disintegrin and metalloproteinase domain-containing protein 21-like n=1 Tax=Diceros bicornis minor TaxID=77932 RepID=UPI0026F072C8|nr:disintegrin and metalloproteinase domain-containing protein 21-like [Diceros bicornis minor]
MRLAEAQVTLRTPLLLLGLWASLAPVQRSQGHPSWRYISTEVVIPKKESQHGKGIQMPGWLSYSLHFGGQRHVIHMRRKKLFVPRDLLLMTQDDQGALQMDYPFVPLGCYYLGYLEEVPFSMVTMDTCYGGLKGIMKLDDLAYEIRPLKDSQRFEHIVSQIVADRNAMGPTYRLGYEERDPLFSQANASEVPRISSKLYASHRGLIRGLLMSSRSIYNVYNNVTNCAIFMINLASLIDTMYQSLDIGFYVSCVLVYNQRDPTELTVLQVPGSPFFQYFERSLYRTLNPHSSILVNQEGPHELQFNPVLYAMCNAQNLIMVGSLYRHYLLLSIISSQQIGRTLGLYYDESTCICQRRTTCIMNRYPVLTDVFSNCSFEHTQHIVGNNVAKCIFSSHMLYHNKSLTHARCGNYIVDIGEQCDCGSFKQCYSNQCCNSDCRLTPGSACNTGRCCANCTYAPVGTLCRPIQNICDLPEYCGGVSLECPSDFYLQDGTPCTEEGYCYHGNCTDRTVHCKEIFGETAVKAPDSCYTINRKGHRYGHCRRAEEEVRFQACAEADILCGRLQCINVTHLPQLQEHVGFHQSLISGHLCFGVDSHRSTGATDVGHVRSGTLCAPGRFCDNTYCNGTMEQINYDCVPHKCSLRGICNNLRNCHCHVGWEPPRCIQRGAGGSVDSGPPPRRVRTVSHSQESVIYLRVAFGRIYAFITVLLFGVATNVRTIKTIEVKEVTVDEIK